MNIAPRVVLAFVSVLAAATVAGAAADPDLACRSAKLGAGGKYASAALVCQSKAARTGAAVDPACLSKAALKFTGAFATAEDKAGGACNGVAATTQSIVDDMFDAVLVAIPTPGGGGLCASLAQKSAGKFAGSFLTAWSKFVTKGDAAARDGSLAKARSTLQKLIAKAETKSGCTAGGQYEAARAAVEDTLAAVTACIGSSNACVETQSEAGSGDTVTTDPMATGPSPEVPLTSSVETPNAGTVILRVTDNTLAAPSGYSVLGRQVDVTAPDASTSSPLVLTFVIDASLLPMDPNTVHLTRNGVVIEDCTGAPGVADPDPCLQSRTIVGGGDLQLVALSSHASQWFPVLAGGCPTAMVWAQRADTASTDRATEIDMGWSGHLHNVDPVDGARTGLLLSCPGTSQPSCGTCDITGFDPTTTACRCANNPRNSCDEPNLADADDCGGATCQCYTEPPTPLSVGGTSSCLLRKATANPTGTWDPVLGQGSATLSDTTQFYLGGGVDDPCPRCVGDPVANDGVRGGTCNDGASSGLTCDANGSDPSFPSGGGSTSYDCLPSPGSNITGPGIRITRTETTGAAATLASGIPCVGGSGNCPCAVCSGDTSMACSSDTECANASAGTCTSVGSGVTVRQNDCSGACTAGIGGEGTCPPADDSKFCDAIVEEDGRGIVACLTNADCDALFPFVVAGDCTVYQPRSCFLSPVQASGSPDPAQPLTAATFCVPPTSSFTVNSVLGLPGPGRARTVWDVTYTD